MNAHAVTFEPDLHETIYPLGTEMLYAVALAFRGPVACRLVQWVLGVCFAGNVIGAGPARAWAIGRGGPGRWPCWSRPCPTGWGRP